jgi:hypothetical protein
MATITDIRCQKCPRIGREGDRFVALPDPIDSGERAILCWGCYEQQEALLAMARARRERQEMLGEGDSPSLVCLSTGAYCALPWALIGIYLYLGCGDVAAGHGWGFFSALAFGVGFAFHSLFLIGGRRR